MALCRSDINLPLRADLKHGWYLQAWLYMQVLDGTHPSKDTSSTTSREFSRSSSVADDGGGGGGTAMDWILFSHEGAPQQGNNPAGWGPLMDFNDLSHLCMPIYLHNYKSTSLVCIYKTCLPGTWFLCTHLKVLSSEF